MSFTEIAIQKVDLAGISRVYKLAQRIWPNAFEHILSKQQIAYMLEMMYALPVLEKELQRGVEYYMLSYKNKDAGYTAIEKRDETSYKLHKIYLSQQLQGKSLGKYQLQEMEQIVKNRGTLFLYLNVNRHNKAVDFYKARVTRS